MRPGIVVDINEEEKLEEIKEERKMEMEYKSYDT